MMFDKDQVLITSVLYHAKDISLLSYAFVIGYTYISTLSLNGSLYESVPFPILNG